MGFVFSRVFKIKHCIFLCLVYSGVVNAYKVETHESLSAAALMQSTLNDSTKNVLTNLGLNNDINSSAQEFPAYGGDKDGQLLNVEELVKYGANFEDDGVRSVTHFFDPVNDRGLTFGLKLGARSVDWALEDSEAIGNFIGIQEYSYNDANQYLFLALTAQNKDERDQNWGRLFQSIGQVVHHIQDMAQPDHVRNDQHLEIPIPFTGIEVPIDPSWYESYSNLKFIDGITNVSLDYQIPDFPAAREYWTTRAVDFDIENRRGMADFTNKNFVSKNTTFTINDGFFDSNSEYVLPIPHPAPITIVLSDPSLLGDTGTLLCDSMKASNPSLVFPAEGCSMDFVSTTINDSYTNTTSTNDRAATYSIFDKKLTQYGKVANVNYWSGTGAQVDRLFTLNKFNFDAAHNFLIPRAVAYSAGLINHFFSGEINLKYDNEVSSWVIENQSANEMEGEFLIYYEDELENRYWLNEINYSTSTYSAGGILQPFSQMSVDDVVVPDNATKLIIVFKGRLGDEGIPYGDTNVVVSAKLIATFSEYYIDDRLDYVFSDGPSTFVYRPKRFTFYDKGETLVYNGYYQNSTPQYPSTVNIKYENYRTTGLELTPDINFYSFDTRTGEQDVYVNADGIVMERVFVIPYDNSVEQLVPSRFVDNKVGLYSNLSNWESTKAPGLVQEHPIGTVKFCDYGTYNNLLTKMQQTNYSNRIREYYNLSRYLTLDEAKELYSIAYQCALDYL